MQFFKNEAPYLREWIEFNHIVGVDHFFLYNNNSEDNYEEIIEPYVKKWYRNLNSMAEESGTNGML